LIGKLNDPVKLAAIGLGNMLNQLLPYTMMIGMNTALETLVSQAYGRKNIYECGLFLHRSLMLITIMFIPIAVILYYSDSILIFVGIDE
jgi:MATE family multidrug resistance protein